MGALTGTLPDRLQKSQVPSFRFNDLRRKIQVVRWHYQLEGFAATDLQKSLIFSTATRRRTHSKGFCSRDLPPRSLGTAPTVPLAPPYRTNVHREGRLGGRPYR